MFFKFWALFLKVFWGCNFFSRLVLLQWSQFFFDEAFFSFLRPLPGKVRKCHFPGSLLNIETNSFNTILQLINPNSAWKNRVKQIKANQHKLLQWCIFYPSAKNPEHGIKMRQNLALFFCYHLSYNWVNLICLTCLTFPKSLWWIAWTFWV